MLTNYRTLAEMYQNFTATGGGGNTDRFEELYCAALQENLLEQSDDEMLLSYRYHLLQFSFKIRNFNFFNNRLLESKKKKKRKRYYVPVKLYPRILKNDIRRYFSKMMINSFNSCTDEMMEGFLRTYAVHDCHMIRFAPHAVVSNVPQLQYVEGASNIVSIFRKQMLTAPDIAVQLIDCVIIPNVDREEGSKVAFKIESRFTKVFTQICSMDSKDLLEAHKNRVHYCGHLQTNNTHEKTGNHWVVPTTFSDGDGAVIIPPTLTSASSLSSPSMEGIIEQINKQKLAMEPCDICCQSIQYVRIPKPITFIRSSQITIHLDQYNRMYRMEVNAANPPTVIP